MGAAAPTKRGLLTARPERIHLTRMTPTELFLLAASAAVMVPAEALGRARALDDVALISAALGRDRAASLALTERVGPFIRARVLRATRGRPLAGLQPEDVMQEVWCRLLADDGRRLRAYDPARGKTLGGFVNMIAAQVMSNLIEESAARKRRPEGGFTDLEHAPEASSAAPRPDQAVQARGALASMWKHLEATLPPSGRLVLQMLYADQLTPDEIARRLGCSPNTVYSWRFKIKKAALAYRASQDREAG